MYLSLAEVFERMPGRYLEFWDILTIDEAVWSLLYQWEG